MLEPPHRGFNDYPQSMKHKYEKMYHKLYCMKWVLNELTLQVNVFLMTSRTKNTRIHRRGFERIGGQVKG